MKRSASNSYLYPNKKFVPEYNRSYTTDAYQFTPPALLHPVNQFNREEDQVQDDALLQAFDEEFDDTVLTQLLQVEKMYMSQQKTSTDGDQIQALKQRIYELEQRDLLKEQERQRMEMQIFEKQGEIAIVRENVKKLELEKTMLLGNLMEKQTENQNMQQQAEKKYSKDIEKLQTELLFQSQELNKMKSSSTRKKVYVEKAEPLDFSQPTVLLVPTNGSSFQKAQNRLNLESLIDSLLLNRPNAYTICNNSLSLKTLKLLKRLKVGIDDLVVAEFTEMANECFKEKAFKLLEIHSWILVGLAELNLDQDYLMPVALDMVKIIQDRIRTIKNYQLDNVNVDLITNNSIRALQKFNDLSQVFSFSNSPYLLDKRQPINTLLGFIKLLHKHLESSGDYKCLFEAVDASGRSLVYQLLAVFQSFKETRLAILNLLNFLLFASTSTVQVILQNAQTSALLFDSFSVTCSSSSQFIEFMESVAKKGLYIEPTRSLWSLVLDLEHRNQPVSKYFIANNYKK